MWILPGILRKGWMVAVDLHHGQRWAARGSCRLHALQNLGERGCLTDTLHQRDAFASPE